MAADQRPIDTRSSTKLTEWRKSNKAEGYLREFFSRLHFILQKAWLILILIRSYGDEDEDEDVQTIFVRSENGL